jgi:hypothetical protein
MLTRESRSEIRAINVAFAAEFARERAAQADGRWFEPPAFRTSDPERRHEPIATYVARQKDQKLAHEEAAKKASTTPTAPPPRPYHPDGDD